MDKERLLKLLDKLNERSERWIEDALSREDYSDSVYYQGQQKVVLEIQNIVSKW